MSIPDGAAARVRALRLSKSMTLAELSGRSGLPISTLSKIENGKVSLSYDKLNKLSLGLGTDMAYFVTAEPSVLALAQHLGRRCATLSGHGSRIETSRLTYHYHATDLLNKKMTPMIIDVKAGPAEQDSEWSRHAGEEFLLVLDGEVCFRSELYAPIVLKKGESLYFDGAMGHSYRRNTDDPAVILSIASASYEELVVTRPPAFPELPPEDT
jgi:transcriptional regulator with XRE-family HTH domain